MELCRACKCGTATLFYVVYFLPSLMYVNGLEGYPPDHEKALSDKVSKPEEYLFFYQGVEGTPGVDFPVYSHIPRTTFSCKGLESGYYADIDTDCQVFHICEDEKKISFLCPNGTIFQQSDLICEWWFKVNCSHSPYLYEESAENLRENTAKRKSFRRVRINSEEVNNKNAAPHKINSLADSLSTDRFNNQYHSNTNREKPFKPNSNNNFNKKDINNQSPPRTTSIPIRNINNSIKNQEKHLKTKTNHRNQIIQSNNQKNQSNSHQKTRRFNENELGNYQNLDYDKPVSTLPPTTEKYTETIFKGYHIQFPPSTSGEDITFKKKKIEIEKGPEYTNDDATTKNQKYEFESHVNTNENNVNRNNHLSQFNERTNRPQQNNNEAQITQESASFLKNSLKHETTSYNPFPNHRTTYSDLKTVPYVSTKIYSTISSVTPQYITTQPINNGKPFLGSRIGINIKSTNDPLFVNQDAIQSSTKNKIQLVADDVFKVHVISNTKNVTNSSLVSPKVLEKILFAKIKPLDDSTTSKTQQFFETSTSTTEQITTVNDFFSTVETTVATTTKPVTKSFKSRSQLVTKSSKSNSQLITKAFKSTLQKNNVKTTTVTTKPFLIQYDETDSISTQKPKTTDYDVIYGSYASTPTPSNSVQVKFNKTTNKIGIQLGKAFGSVPIKNLSGIKALNQNKSSKNQQSLVRPAAVSQDKSKEEILVRHSSKSIPQSIRDSQNVEINNKGNSGFYVTKSQELPYSTTLTPSTETTVNELNLYNIVIRSTTQQPRPFKKYFQDISTLAQFDTTSTRSNVPVYQISTASPFIKSSSTLEPTYPTPFRTTTPSIYENIDNMIDVLAEITKENEINGNAKARPGLVVPPSVGPQTLHTLAVYFANALDEVIAKNVQNNGKFTEKFMEENKDKLTTLLTQMTVHGYHQLFNQKHNITLPDIEPILNDTNKNITEDEKLKLESPQIRQLARNFTLALSAYLNDPDMFKKDLENLRPTEPPSAEAIEPDTFTEYGPIDEELLNYSDADPKTSFPPIFSTPRAPAPTWGFIIAAKSPNKFEVENNVINSDLNTADTQSFVPGLNDLTSNSEKNKIATTQELPENHWTTSTSATSLWQNTFSINPALVNEEFESSSPLQLDSDSSKEPEFTTPESLPLLGQTRDVNYELHSLPKFSVNSSEVSGILIDFMNNSSDDSNDRLHRILRKLNTTENEFLIKMKEIESNPITRRLILLLISECGKNATEDIKHHNSNSHNNDNSNSDSIETLELSESNPLVPNQPSKEPPPMEKNPFQIYVDPNLKEDDQDTRALQLLNTLYSIASKLGK